MRNFVLLAWIKKNLKNLCDISKLEAAEKSIYLKRVHFGYRLFELALTAIRYIPPIVHNYDLPLELPSGTNLADYFKFLRWKIYRNITVSALATTAFHKAKQRVNDRIKTNTASAEDLAWIESVSEEKTVMRQNAIGSRGLVPTKEKKNVDELIVQAAFVEDEKRKYREKFLVDDSHFTKHQFVPYWLALVYLGTLKVIFYA